MKDSLRGFPLERAGSVHARAGAQREEEQKNGTRIGEIAARSHEIERDAGLISGSPQIARQSDETFPLD